MPDWGVALAVSQAGWCPNPARTHIGERHPIADD
jgi:hypothetical protein